MDNRGGEAQGRAPGDGGMQGQIWRITWTAVIALAAPVGALLSRQAMLTHLHHEMPTYFTFYPAVMLVAMCLGLWPGVLATLVAGLLAAYYIIPPEGILIRHAADAATLAIFGGFGVFLSVVAELYRRKRRKATEYERKEALRGAEENNLRLARAAEEQRRIGEAVERERRRLHDALDLLPAYVVLLTPDYQVQFANRYFEEHFGRAEGRRCYEYLFQRTEPCENCESFRVLTSDAVHRWEWVGPDRRHYEIHDFRFTDCDGAKLVMEVGVDITEGKAAEEKLRVLNRSLRALTDCHQLSLRAPDEQELLDGVCRILVEQCGHTLAWVGHPEQDEAKTIRALAVAGTSADYVTSGLVTWADVELGRGPTGTVIRTGQVMAIDDATSDPRFAPWRDRALAKGLRSCVCLPIDIGEALPLSLSIYSPRTGTFQGEELNLLTELAQDIGYGIRTLRMRAEREQAEARLVEQQFYTRSLIEASPDPLVTISRQGKITDVNRATELATGATREQLIGSDFSDYFTEPEKARAGYQQVFADGFVQDYPLAIRHRSGRVTDVLYNATVYRDRKGAVEGVFAAARDVTERRRAEAAVLASEQRYRSLVIATAQVVWSTNPEGEVDDMPMWRELTGQSVEQVRGHGWLHALHPEDRERTHSVWAAAVRTRALYDTEYRVRRHDGEYRDLWARGVPVMNSDGSIREWVGTCTDITDRKRAEEQLRRYAAELERSNAELQDFASIASHDLQEPLRKVIAFGEHLKEHLGENLDQLGKDFLGRMQNAAQRMSLLIEALLAYSRVTTRAQPFQPVDLLQVLFEVLVDLEERIAQSRARIEFVPLPRVMADATQIRQVLQNLVANALKFQRPGVLPHLEIEGGACGGACQISVRDNGIGFDERYLDRIFRPFQRLHGRHQYPGSGMGLAICRKVVARHGGTLTAHSRPGEGSTFVVSLPATSNLPATESNREAREEFVIA